MPRHHVERSRVETEIHREGEHHRVRRQGETNAHAKGQIAIRRRLLRVGADQVAQRLDAADPTFEVETGPRRDFEATADRIDGTGDSPRIFSKERFDHPDAGAAVDTLHVHGDARDRPDVDLTLEWL